MKSSSILDKILKGGGASTPTPPTDHFPDAEEMGRAIQPTQHAHQIPVRPRLPLAERITQVAGVYPEARAVTNPAEEKLGPQTRHHIEHLERQVKMAEMRLKETRQQLAEKAAQFGEAVVAVALMEERYEELEYSEIAEWVEENVFPRLREVLGMPAGEKGGAL